MGKRYFVLLLIFSVLNLSLTAGNFSFRICHIPEAPWKTETLIINPGTGDVTVRFHHLLPNGNEQVDDAFTLSPGGVRILDAEALGTGGIGWLNCIGDTPPAVILQYRFGDSKSICRFTLTADSTGTKWLLPLPAEEPQDWYGIAAANFDSDPLELTVTGIANGQAIEQTTLTIESKQKAVDTLAHIFRQMNFQQPDYLRITASAPIPAPIGIAGNTDQDRHLFFSGEPIVPAAENQARYSIPHIAESSWATSLEIINPDSGVNRDATLYRPYKTPCARPISEISLDPLEEGTIDLGKTGEPGPLVLNSRQPVLARLQYRYKDSPSICSFFLHNRWSRKWILPDTKENWLNWHGIAIGNPLSVPVSITLTAMGPAGPIASATQTLENGGKWVGLTWQWFSDNEENAPDLSQTIYFQVESDIQLSAPLLIAGNTAQNRHVFLPGIPVETPDPFIKSGPALGSYWPDSGWRECRPEEVGMDSEKLRDARDYAANPAINTHGLLIIRDGYIVAEEYFQGNTRDTIRHSFSIAKSFSSCLTGIALDRGEISDINIPIYTFFPEWQQPGTPAVKKRITLRQLLTMTSGIQWNQDAPDYDLTMMILSGDYISYVLNKDVTHEPGTYWQYNNGAASLFSGIIQQSTGMTAEAYANTVLFPEIGFKYDHWDSDETGHSTTAWGIYTTVRQFAKFGYLYLNNGNWNGNQVISKNFVQLSRQPVSYAVNWYGFMWWLKPSLQNWENSAVPDNLMIAWGKYSQQIFIMPDQRLLVLRFGNDPYSTTDQWDETEFLTKILNAITD